MFFKIFIKIIHIKNGNNKINENFTIKNLIKH